MEFRRWKIAEVDSVGAKKVILFGELATALFSGLFGGDGFVSSMVSKHHMIKGQSTSQNVPIPS